METVLIILALAVVVAGRIVAGKLAAEFIESLPAQERARIRRFEFSA